MKILGLIGGIFWVSTIDYYRYINQGVNKELGGNEFPEFMIYSVNYGEIIRYNEAKDFDSTFRIVLKACLHLKKAGCGAIVLCANTMHMFAHNIEKQTGLPVIHIAIATADAISAKGLKKVGLLGTKPTMEMDFFKNKLTDQHIEAITPGEEDRNFIHEKILTELAREVLKQETKHRFLSIIQDLISKGAEGIILGCTEIPLLIKQEDVSVPIFDTTRIHANAAVAFALS